MEEACERYNIKLTANGLPDSRTTKGSALLQRLNPDPSLENIMQ